MRRSSSPLTYIASVLAVGVVLLGWTVCIDQLATDGWTSGGGMAWLLALAALATIGAVTVTRALLAGRHGWAAIGLVFTAASPTVFLYPLNVLLLILAIIEAIRAIPTSRQIRSSSVH
jgi:hypothetical protein